MVRKIIKKIRSNYHVDGKRIYIIGYSMGATGVWDIITRHPKTFAGAIILNGRSDPSQASQISSLPLWVSHGKFDRVSPISNAREMIAQINKLDGNVIFKELYWGHGITRVALSGQAPFRWLFKQQKPF
jgi:predicted peptidase